MERFIVLVHYEATPKNANFYGKKDGVQNWFKGKNHRVLHSLWDAYELGEEDYTKLSPYFIIEYGYSTKAAAMRGLKAYKELAQADTDRGLWNVTCKLIKVEFDRG